MLNPPGTRWLVLVNRQDTPQLGTGTPVSCENLLYPVLAHLVTTLVSSWILFLAKVLLPSLRVCVCSKQHGICSLLFDSKAEIALSSIRFLCWKILMFSWWLHSPGKQSGFGCLFLQSWYSGADFADRWSPMCLSPREGMTAVVLPFSCSVVLGQSNGSSAHVN